MFRRARVLRSVRGTINFFADKRFPQARLMTDG